MTIQQYKEEFYNLDTQNDILDSQETQTMQYILRLCHELQYKMYSIYFLPDQAVPNE